MTVDLDDPNWRYISCPFIGRVVTPQSASKAFKGVTKGQETHTTLVLGFATQATRKLILNSYMRNSTDNEMRLPDIGDRGLRNNINKWRSTLFLERKFLIEIIERMAASLDVTASMRDVFLSGAGFIIKNGLFKKLDKDERARRESVWVNVRECFQRCENGLTTHKHSQKFSGYTGFDFDMARWRYFYSLVEEKEQVEEEFGFDPDEHIKWMHSNTEFKETLKKVDKERLCKRHCRACMFSEKAYFPEDIFIEMSSYLSNYKLGDIDNFYKLFVSSFIYAWIRVEGSMLMFLITEAFKNYETFSSDEFKSAFILLSYMHDNYLRFANTVSVSFIDCLAEASN